MGADLVAKGYARLASGDWEQARRSFELALAEEESAEALDGLGQALWWLKDSQGAISCREEAYARFRRKGNSARAVRIALWLAREYDTGLANHAASGGWLARAETLLRELPPGPDHGWLELARSERAMEPSVAHRHAERALETARSFQDRDLEISSLAQVGLARVQLGRVEEGMACFDEAMAAGTGGEAADLQTIGDTCCKMVAACELSGDAERLSQWAQVVDTFVSRHNHLPLLAFCGACCAELFIANGHWGEAERELLGALQGLRAADQEARCVHPAARLAELRALQGRLEEAEQLLSGYESLPEAVRPAASLHLARGEYAAAEMLLNRRLRQLGGDTLLSAPLLSLLVDVELAKGDVAAARDAAQRLGRVAQDSGQLRVEAEAQLQAGRALVMAGEAAGVELLERALELYGRLGMPLQAARARLELARAMEGESPEVAIAEARAALATFEELGAPREADAAAALMRRMGAGGRTGPKGYGVLSQRELEVLRLLGQGLTNAEIAARLYISTKTAGNHVSNILSKLALRNRAEAAGYAQRHLPEISVSE
jgi:DNA-binding CsgD family transcriptional regulator